MVDEVGQGVERGCRGGRRLRSATERTGGWGGMSGRTGPGGGSNGAGMPGVFPAASAETHPVTGGNRMVLASGSAAKLAVLIDADNAQPAITEGLLAEVAKYGTAHVKRAYGDWTGASL